MVARTGLIFFIIIAIFVSLTGTTQADDKESVNHGASNDPAVSGSSLTRPIKEADAPPKKYKCCLKDSTCGKSEYCDLDWHIDECPKKGVCSKGM